MSERPDHSTLEPVDAAAAPWTLVYDTNADALLRRMGVARQAAAGSVVHGFTSVTALMLHAQCAPAGSVALIDLFDADRYSIERPGERVISRLWRAKDDLRLVAWTAHISPDVLAGAYDAGAEAVVISGLDPDAEVRSLIEAIARGADAPVPRGPKSISGAPDLADWFRDRYGLAWAPWMEPALVRLATTGERAAHALELMQRDAAVSQKNGIARLRDLAKALGGERYRNTALVAREANLVLALIAAERPLPERPQATASLGHTAQALEREPSLATAAYLSSVEVDDLLGQWAAIEAKRSTEAATVGTKPAGWAEAERQRAAGHRAAELGAPADRVEAAAAGVIARTERAILAVAEAQRDALYVPEARAAAALLAAAQSGQAVAAPGVEGSGSELRWNGLTPLELSVAREADPVALRDLTRAIDAVLAAAII